MTAGQWIGAVMCALPFAGMFVLSVREFGWTETLIGLAGVAGLIAFFGVGSYLLTGGK